VRRTLTEAVKRRVRRTPMLYELVRQRRAGAQEAAYVERSRHYARAAGPVFSFPGWAARSAELLHAGWDGRPTPKVVSQELRVFAAVANDAGGPQVVGPLSEAFETVHFDLADYRTLYRPETTTDLTWRTDLQRDLVEAFEAAHAERPVDVVLAYGSHLDFEPETLQALRGHGVPVCVLCLDDKHRFEETPGWGYPNGQKPLIGSVDVHLTNSRECLRWYLAENAAAYYMPQGIDVDVFAPRDVPQDIDVSFLGQRYGARAAFIEALSRAGIEVECFGPGWGRTLTDDERIDLYSRSKICLGIGGVAYSERITCIKGRDFEVPAAGGVYLTTYEPELTEVFELGRELLCYRNEIDCAEQIRYYLERDDERRSIGQAGRERCVREHTWGQRLSGLFAWMGLLESTRASA
jgi:hypothetical protein